jgi:hypothetical protein
MSAYSTLSDQELLELLKKEDRLAFTEIYERYAPKLYYQINQLLKDADTSQDLVQDIFIAVWNKARNIKAGANFAGYLPIPIYLEAGMVMVYTGERGTSEPFTALQIGQGKEVPNEMALFIFSSVNA